MRVKVVNDNIDTVQTGEILKRYREKNGFSITEIAEVTGASRSSVYAWESGRAVPLVHHLVSLSMLYKCSIDDFIATYI